MYNMRAKRARVLRSSSSMTPLTSAVDSTPSPPPQLLTPPVVFSFNSPSADISLASPAAPVDNPFHAAYLLLEACSLSPELQDMWPFLANAPPLNIAASTSSAPSMESELSWDSSFVDALFPHTDPASILYCDEDFSDGDLPPKKGAALQTRGVELLREMCLQILGIELAPISDESIVLQTITEVLAGNNILAPHPSTFQRLTLFSIAMDLLAVCCDPRRGQDLWCVSFVFPKVLSELCVLTTEQIQASLDKYHVAVPRWFSGKPQSGRKKRGTFAALVRDFILAHRGRDFLDITRVPTQTSLRDFFDFGEF